MGDLFEVYPSRETSNGLRYRLGGRPSSYQAAVVDAKVDEVLLVYLITNQTTQINIAK